MGEDITKRFDPIQMTADGVAAMEEVRDMFKALAVRIEELSWGSRAQSVAFTELESAHRAVNRAIAEAHEIVIEIE